MRGIRSYNLLSSNTPLRWVASDESHHQLLSGRAILGLDLLVQFNIWKLIFINCCSRGTAILGLINLKLWRRCALELLLLNMTLLPWLRDHYVVQMGRVNDSCCHYITIVLLHSARSRIWHWPTSLRRHGCAFLRIILNHICFLY
jgi:hypothetical protein